MPVSGSIEGYGTWEVPDEVWAGAKSRPVFLGAAAPEANILLDAVLRAGPTMQFTPQQNDMVQVRRANTAQPWGAPEAVDIATAAYIVTKNTAGEYLFRRFGEWEVRKYVPGSEPTEPPPEEPEPEVDPWVPQRTYARDALVTWQGQVYRCLQPHTSQPGWDPVSAPALWVLA